MIGSQSLAENTKRVESLSQVQSVHNLIGTQSLTPIFAHNWAVSTGDFSSVPNPALILTERWNGGFRIRAASYSETWQLRLPSRKNARETPLFSSGDTENRCWPRGDRVAWSMVIKHWNNSLILLHTNYFREKSVSGFWRIYSGPFSKFYSDGLAMKV